MEKTRARPCKRAQPQGSGMVKWNRPHYCAALLESAALRGGSSAADRTRFIALERDSLPGKANASPGKFAGVVHQEIDPVSLRSRGQGLRKQPRSETSARAPSPHRPSEATPGACSGAARVRGVRAIGVAPVPVD
ncbi:MAG: hypothetical protein MZV70_40675 [Desulfobacterales bacterium]|nr:hypothetical protein [Desulfobacterales bacterium]